MGQGGAAMKKLSGSTRTRQAWRSMHRRCTDPAIAHFERYGGRGITVCERWRSFDNFLADMGEAPPNLSLDRRDNDGNYEPGNCRWATQSEQLRNSTTARILEFRGKAQCVTAWAEELGLAHNSIQKRLRDGWSIKRALSTPKMGGWP